MADALAPMRARADARDGLLSGERRAMTIGLVLVITLVAFEGLAIATALPAAQDDLGGVRLYGWAFSAFLLMSLIGVTWAGQECDARGPARPFAIGVVTLGIGLLLGGLAPSMLVLVAGRAVQGLGAGVIPAVAYVIIGRGYEERLRVRMFAVMSTAWVLPSLIGPAIAGVVSDYATWRIVFVGLLPILAVAAAMTQPSLRRMGAPEGGASRDGDRRRVAQAALLALGAALVLGGFSAASRYITPPLVVAGAVIALWAFRQLMPAGTLHAAPGLPAVIAGMGLVNLAFFGVDAFIPYMLTNVRGTSTLVAGLSLTTAALSWTAGSWTLERLEGRVPRATTMRVGLMLIIIGIGGAMLTAVTDVPVATVALAWGIAGLGMGFTYQTFSLALLSAVPEGDVGRASSSMKLAEALGPAMGAGIAGALVAAGAAGDWEAAAIALSFGLMAGAAGACIIVAGRIPVRPIAADDSVAMVA